MACEIYNWSGNGALEVARLEVKRMPRQFTPPA